jgi:hypothetical protein
MPDSTRQRLERLADDAQELAESSHGVFGFVLLAGPEGTRIRDSQTWVQVGRHARGSVERDEVVRLEDDDGYWDVHAYGRVEAADEWAITE